MDKYDDIKSEDVGNLELDVLSLFYGFSDQYGRVDMEAAATYAYRQFGYIISRTPYQLTQKHLDVLMDRERVFDTRALFNVIKLKAAE